MIQVRPSVQRKAFWATLFLGLFALWAVSPTLANGKGWLGVVIREMTPSMQEEFELGNRFGLLVTEVVPNSPADDAGLQEDDVILEFNGTPVKMANAFSRMVRQTEPGKEVKLTIWRDGKEQTLTVTVEKYKRPRRPRVMAFDGLDEDAVVVMMGRPWLGVRVQDLNEDLAAYFKVKPHTGVLVLEVLEDSPAEAAGIKAGDIITKLDDKAIKDRETLLETIEEYDDGDVVKVAFVRNGKKQSAEIELEVFTDLPMSWPGRWQMHRGMGNWDMDGYRFYQTPGRRRIIIRSGDFGGRII